MRHKVVPVYDKLTNECWTVKANDVIAVQGGARSGHNAIMHWVAANVKGTCLLCVHHSYPLMGMRYPGVGREEGGLHGAANAYFYEDGKRYSINMHEHYPKTVDVVVFRNEWPIPNEFDFGVDCKNLYVLRDIRNQLASIHKGHDWLLKTKDFMPRLLNGWLTYCKLEEDEDNIVLNYDNWCRFVHYQCDILQKLGDCFYNTPVGIDFSPNKGSAFDNKDYQSRWLPYAEAPWFKQLMGCPGIAEEVERHFLCASSS